MPRTEARVFTSIWKDPEFLSLSVSAQRLYFFLLSQEDLSYCGVMPLRERRWQPKAAGLTLAELELDIKALEATQRRFIVIDSDSGELFVRSLLRRDGIWRQPNLLKQARESATQIESQMIRDCLLAELRRLPLDETPSEQVRTLVADFIADLEQGTAYPNDYPPGNPSGDPLTDPNRDPDGNPSGDPSDKDHARARGIGERNGSSRTAPQTPVPRSPSVSPSDRRLGTRLPEDFAVTAEMVAWARENAPHVDGKRETERFCDYWHAKPGKDGRKLDWVKTWKNWMRTAEDRQGPRGRPVRQQETDDLFGRNIAREMGRGTPMGELP